ncbi:ribonuclease H-like domain-containing protein [Tanacetum coccineum]
MEAKTSVKRCKEVERGLVYYGGDEEVFFGLKVTSSLQGGDKEVKEASKVVTRTGLSVLLQEELFCDNKSPIQIAANPVMHEKTKHFDIDVHLVREKVASGLIKTVKVDIKSHIGDILSKALGTYQHSLLLKKLGLLNVFVA